MDRSNERIRHHTDPTMVSSNSNAMLAGAMRYFSFLPCLMKDKEDYLSFLLRLIEDGDWDKLEGVDLADPDEFWLLSKTISES